MWITVRVKGKWVPKKVSVIAAKAALVSGRSGVWVSRGFAQAVANGLNNRGK